MSDNIKKIGVIGAGQMGNGIAHVCALSGFDVQLIDVSPENLEKGLAAIDRNMARQVSRNEIMESDVTLAKSHIQSGTELSGLSDCDMVVEAATEDESVKKTILGELCQHLKESALVASNTSSISITRLGSYTDRPGKFVGMHFMNPVPRMELVELIRGIATDEDTFAVFKDLTIRLGKTPVSAEDFPAFIVNRMPLTSP